MTVAVSDEVRAAAVRRVRSGESKAAVAKALGVSAASVTNWWREAEQQVDVDEQPADEPAGVEDEPTIVPPVELAPVPAPPPLPPASEGEVCGICRPPQGVHPLATSFTCDHGHWVFGPADH